MKTIVSILLLCLTLFAKEPAKIVQTELQGSKIYIAEPATWNKKILLYAHGLRVEDSPLSAEIDIKNSLNTELLDQGWIIASTSYRRNGMIVRDAIEDIEYLRKHLLQTYGQPEEIYLYGSSMGGKIAALLAEENSGKYKAAFILGVGMRSADAVNPLTLNYKPQIPILFVSNKTEIQGPLDYIAKAEATHLKPVFWKIDSPGHCSISNPENKEAFLALLNYVATGKIETDKTILINEKLDKSEAKFDGSTIYIKAKGTSNIKGNLNISDLEQIGLKKGNSFEVGFKNKSYKVLWGDTYGDVQPGCWVGFIEANGGFKIARNFVSAVRFLGCKEGDEIFIRPLSFAEKQVNEAAEKLANEASDLILKKEFIIVKEKSLQALAIDSLNFSSLINLTYAYLYNNELEKALELAKRNKGYRSENGQYYYEDLLLEDLEYFEKQGLVHENSKYIREVLQK